MAQKLTEAQIALCEQFECFLRGLVKDGMTSASVSWIDRSNTGGFPTASVQDIHEAFGGEFECRTLAAKLQNALDKFAAANPNEEERRAKRIADLQSELALLTKEAA